MTLHLHIILHQELLSTFLHLDNINQLLLQLRKQLILKGQKEQILSSIPNSLYSIHFTLYVIWWLCSLKQKIKQK
jgi:hypothetical protein